MRCDFSASLLPQTQSEVISKNGYKDENHYFGWTSNFNYFNIRKKSGIFLVTLEIISLKSLKSFFSSEKLYHLNIKFSGQLLLQFIGPHTLIRENSTKNCTKRHLDLPFTAKNPPNP